MLITIRDTTAVVDVYLLFIDAFCQTLFVCFEKNVVFWFEDISFLVFMKQEEPL